jgi:hypothetical protein
MPVDCEIHSGETDIDRSLVNGESMSAYVKKGDLLEAGVLNLTSSIEVIAASTSETSFLAEIQKIQPIVFEILVLRSKLRKMAVVNMCVSQTVWLKSMRPLFIS